MADEDEKLSAAEVLRLYGQGQRDFRGLEIDDCEHDGFVFRGAVLEGTDFSRAFIVADFADAHLRGASFHSGKVKTCKFDRADLSNTDFRDAAIDAATFVGANLDGADFEGASEQGCRYRKGERPI